MEKILIVEDDPEIAMLEKDYLEMNGYDTEIVTDGVKALERLNCNSYDLILLDLMLPGRNGYDICREIRNKIDVPIIMATAKTELADKIRGLGIGADDYIAKPFDPAELAARVKAHLNRYKRLKVSGKDSGVITVANIRILSQSWKVYKDEIEIKFPNREFELLLFLSENPDIVFSKEQIFEKIWGYDYVGDSATVTVHINRIREKIEDDPSKPHIIETIWGAGYRLNS